MSTPSFIHRKEEYLDRVAKTNTDIRLLARHNSLEVMKQKVAQGSTFYLDSAEEWQGFEFIYLLKGKMAYTGVDPSVEMEPGDYISREKVSEQSWFETSTDVILLYTSSQPAFHLLREEIEDYLQLAEEIESTEQMDGHSKRLVRMSYEVGKKLGLSTERLSALRYSAFFHDLGKAKVPNRLLEKEDELTEEEWEIMKKHAKWGKEMLEELDDLDYAGKIVEQTHERMDGEGYPKGLESEEILLEAKIVAAVDAWDAMRTSRPYREALSREEAMQELEDNAGSQFDPRVVEIFLSLLREREELNPSPKERTSYKDEIALVRQSERFNQVAKSFISIADPTEIIGKTLEAVIETTTFQRALLSLFDRPINPEHLKPAKVKYYDHRGLSEDQANKLQENDYRGTEVVVEKFNSAYRLGESYYLPHEEKREYFEEGAEIESQLQQEETLDWHPEDSLYVPLYKNKNIIGQISVDDPEDGLVPDPERLRPLETFAFLASLGLQNLSLAEKLENLSRKVQSKGL